MAKHDDPKWITKLLLKVITKSFKQSDDTTYCSNWWIEIMTKIDDTKFKYNDMRKSDEHNVKNYWQNVMTQKVMKKGGDTKQWHNLITKFLCHHLVSSPFVITMYWQK
jgi:hypothetical protein